MDRRHYEAAVATMRARPGTVDETAWTADRLRRGIAPYMYATWDQRGTRSEMLARIPDAAVVTLNVGGYLVMNTYDAPPCKCEASIQMSIKRPLDMDDYAYPTRRPGFDS